MSSLSLFKVQSIVAIVLFTSLSAMAINDAGAQAKQAPAGTTSLKAEQVPVATSNDALTYCLQQHPTDYATECKAVTTMLASINGQTSNNTCTQAQSAYSTNYTNVLQQMQTSLDAQTKLTSELQQQKNAIAESQLSARTSATNYNTAVAQINIAIPITKQQTQSATAKAIQSIREKIAELSKDITDANAALRAAASAVQKTTNKQETTCRSAADAAGKAKKAEIDAAAKELKAAIASGKEQVNLLATNAAGYTNRAKAKRLADIETEYLTEYKNCMAGTDAAGSQAREAIDDANQDYADAKVSYNEALAAINDKKALYTQEVAQAEADGVTALAAVDAKAQSDLASLTAKYNTEIDTANTKITESSDTITSMTQANTGQTAINNLASQGANKQLQSSMAGLQVCSGDIAKAQVAAPTSDDINSVHSSNGIQAGKPEVQFSGDPT